MDGSQSGCFAALAPPHILPPPPPQDAWVPPQGQSEPGRQGRGARFGSSTWRRKRGAWTLGFFT